MNTKDIYIVNLDPTIGAEIKKKRPCIIVNSDDVGVLPLKIIVPIMGFNKKHNKSWLVKIEPNTQNGLSKISTADPMQIRSVSHRRLIKKIGTIDEKTYTQLKKAMKIVLNFYFD